MELQNQYDDVPFDDDKKQFTIQETSNYFIEKALNRTANVKWMIALVLILLVMNMLLLVTLIVLVEVHEVHVSCPDIVQSNALVVDNTNATEVLQKGVDGTNQILVNSTARVDQSLLAIRNQLDILQYTNAEGNNLSTSMLAIVNEIRNQLDILEYPPNAGSNNLSTNILARVDEIQNLLEVSTSPYEIVSCKDIKSRYLNSTSGYYNINGQVIYCEMETLCNSTEGWTRLGFLDMSDHLANCPDGFKLYSTDGVRACGRPGDVASCESIKIPSNGISYSEVCGRVQGYQYGQVEAFLHDIHGIDSYYLDGISITRGYPREHIWSFAVGLYKSFTDSIRNCPCNNPPGPSPESFVGNDYYCESGNPSSTILFQLYTENLWDGLNCSPEESLCCSSPNLPWFHKAGLNASSEYLELRLCSNREPSDEDTPFSLYEIYVK